MNAKKKPTRHQRELIKLLKAAHKRLDDRKVKR